MEWLGWGTRQERRSEFIPTGVLVVGPRFQLRQRAAYNNVDLLKSRRKAGRKAFFPPTDSAEEAIVKRSWVSGSRNIDDRS